MRKKSLKRKRRPVDPDLRSSPGLTADMEAFVDRYKYPTLTFTSPTTEKTKTIKPDTTPDHKTGVKNRYQYFYLLNDGTPRTFNVRELPDWDDERDGPRDIEARIKEAVEKGALDLDE